MADRSDIISNALGVAAAAGLVAMLALIPLGPAGGGGGGTPKPQEFALDVAAPEPPPPPPPAAAEPPAPPPPPVPDPPKEPDPPTPPPPPPPAPEVPKDPDPPKPQEMMQDEEGEKVKEVEHPKMSDEQKSAVVKCVLGRTKALPVKPGRKPASGTLKVNITVVNGAVSVIELAETSGSSVLDVHSTEIARHNPDCFKGADGFFQMTFVYQ